MTFDEMSPQEQVQHAMPADGGSDLPGPHSLHNAWQTTGRQPPSTRGGHLERWWLDNLDLLEQAHRQDHATYQDDLDHVHP